MPATSPPELSVRPAAGRSRRSNGDGSVAARRKADGSTVYDVYFCFPDPATLEARRTCKRGFPTSTEASRFLRSQTSKVDAGSYARPAG